MDVRMPDGTVIQNVPEGTTKAQLVEKLQRNGHNVPAEWVQQAGGEWQGSSNQTPKLSRWDKVKQGALDPVNGGAQLLTKALPSGVVEAGNSLNNWLADKTGLVAKLPEGGVDQMTRDQEAAYQDKRKASGESGFDGWRAVGNVASPANLALGAAAPAKATAGLLGRLGVGAGAGAVSSGLAPVTEGDNYWSDKAKQVALGGAVGAAAPALTSGIARIVSPNASKNAELALLKKEGVTPTIGQTLGGMSNWTEQKLTSLPIFGDAISAARGRAMDTFNTAAINRATAPVGGKVSGVGQNAVREAGDMVSNAYDSALSQIPTVKFDQKFAQDLSQLKGMAQSLTPQMRDKFNSTLRDVLGGRTSPANAMLGDTFKKVDSEIGNQAARYGGSSVASEKELGDALKQLQALMREQVARSSPAASKALGAADEGWANLVRVEGAAKAAKNAEGVFTPAQLNTAIQTADKSVRKRSVARGTALMQDLANAGQTVIGNKVPNSFTTDRALIASGGLGAGLVNPLIPAGLIAGAGMYTPLLQRALVALASERGKGPLAESLADAIRNAGLLAAPGAAGAGAQLLN